MQWYEKTMTLKDPERQQKHIFLPIATRKSCHQQTNSDCAIFALSNAVILMRGYFGANKNPKGEDDAWWIKGYYSCDISSCRSSATIESLVEGITLEDASSPEAPASGANASSDRAEHPRFPEKAPQITILIRIKTNKSTDFQVMMNLTMKIMIP